MPVRYTPEGHVAGISAEHVGEATLVIKELRLKRKEYVTNKREITTAIATERAAHRSRKAAAPRHIKGKSFLAGLSNTVTDFNKATEKSQTDQRITALEQQKNVVEERIIQIDKGIVQLETWILSKSS